MSCSREPAPGQGGGPSRMPGHPERFVTTPSHRHHPHTRAATITAMNKTLTTATTALILCAGLAACSSSPKADDDAGRTDASAKAGATTSQPLTAADVLTKISAKVDAAKLSGTVTEANDPNHLLGRPNQYTSKVTFTDGRIKAADVEGTKEGDVERGGAVEVFADAASATARAQYIQAVTKAMPALAEYDYAHGTVLVRVSHYLTPTQAGEYKAAADGLG